MRNIIVTASIAFFLLSLPTHAQEKKSTSSFPDYPEMKFIVFSDPHYFDSALSSEGKAFQAYLDRDRKLLRESRLLLEEVVTFIEKSDADFVLIPGDLTKDGEQLNHLKMAEYLSRISASGKKAFVVPGNHDVNVPDAYKYIGDNKERVPTINRDEFADIYSLYGYGDAILRDENSLSYVAEPVEGLWLLGLDACRYNENPAEGHPITGGKFSKETMVWIENVLKEAGKQNKSIMAMMHHGVLEHYKKQKKHFGEYVVDNFKKVSALLARHGVKMVFTGHYHAQDITMKQFANGNFILDIQTGSLVTYPCPYRVVTVSPDQMLNIESHFITSIPGNPDFAAYSRKYVHSGISGIAANTLVGMKVDSTEAWSLSGQVADAFISHYAGDEVPHEKPFDMTGISAKGKFLIGFKKNLVKSLHHDLYPEDNFLNLKLR
jgi:3',5'-cyclic AMP phosphodiesterase CpdA